MKTAFALVAGLAVWVALGAVFPPSGATAVAVIILAKWGCVSYKALVGLFTYVAIQRV